MKRWSVSDSQIIQKWGKVWRRVALHLGGLLEVDGLGQHLSEVGGNLCEVADGAFLDEALCVHQMAGDVVNQSLACGGVQDGVPEDGGLAEVVLVAAVEAVNLTGEFVRLLQVACALSRLGTFGKQENGNEQTETTMIELKYLRTSLDNSWELRPGCH